MPILNEAKLNAKKRNKLKDSDFGLPKERKYPLNDEAHVRKAIQFFKYCERTKRNELALNINKKIKEYNMDVTVSKDSPFAKYANKNLVTIQEAICDEYIEELVRENMEFITNYNIYSCHDMVKLEEYCKILIDEDLEKCMVRKKHTTLIESINSYLNKEYNDFIEFCGEDSTIYNLIENAKNELIESSDDIEVFQKKIPIFKGIIESTNNKWHIYRVLSEAVASLTSKIDNTDDDITSAVIMRFAKDLDEMKNVYECNIHIPSDERQLIITESTTIFGYPEEWYNTKCMNVSLTAERDNINNELHNINSDLDKICPGCIGSDFSPLRDICIFPDSVKLISRRLNCNMTSDDELFISRYITKTKGKTIDRKYIDNSSGYRMIFTYSTKTRKHYLVAKINNAVKYSIALIELNDDVINYLSGITSSYDVPKVHVIRISENDASFTLNDSTNKFVSEAFAVNDEGDIKITISPKNSYMDSYSANHKMLVENYKNGNYEAMKKNLAYVFALISIIERSDEYKRKDPAVMKARAFAINDFKTYLKHLQSVEPDFDFVEYYRASDYDKKVINIPKSSIIGIKKLMHTILL